MARRRVAVIGAGPAGLVALRLLTNPPSNYEVVIYEKTDRVGGVWNYDPEDGPMYRNLRTNLPKPVMSFHDFPFLKPADHSFPTHQEVLKYINDYADSFNARNFIQFSTEVKEVSPVSEDEYFCKWLIKTCCKHREEESVFDSVFVCNGHYDVPNIPDIPGMDSFTGRVMHSKSYDVPEEFVGEKVVILGAQSSGRDIALDIARCAKEVIVSHKGPAFSYGDKPNVVSRPVVIGFKDNQFVCTDGSKIDGVDTFIFCTGYQYSFPFLDERCGVSVVGNRCTNLWKHLVNIHHPSMFFIGLCQTVTPIPQCAMQCALARAIMEERFKLPGTKEMLADVEAEYQMRVVVPGGKPRHLHVLDTNQWAYNDELAELAGYPKLPRHIGNMYDACAKKRRTELTRYRNYFFELLPQDEFSMVYKEQPTES